MLLLLNTTKTMDMTAFVPVRLKVTEPRLLGQARFLADKVSSMNLAQLRKQMSLSEKLSVETRNNAVLWGLDDRPKIPALFAFTGLLYKSLDVASLDAAQRNDAQKRVRILSGLYGMLRPFDLIEAYRLEMGQKLLLGKAKNIAAFWKKSLTAELNKDLKAGEPIVSLAAQEYMKALDFKGLKGPVILPVFKEEHGDGTFKTVAVHAKKARGELVRYALVNKSRVPLDLMRFNAMGWKAKEKPPEQGTWLFTRPAPS